MPTLQWLTKEEDVQAARKVPYRLLEEVPELSYGDSSSGNMLIQGDNLDALKALLPYYAGKVKCIYIDPPFNTGQAFQHYDDNLEHSIWLAMMYPRVELLRELLSEKGTIAFHLDAEELAYCIVIFDEIFGRGNRIGVCTFKQGAVVGHKAINPGLVTVTNYVVIYAKNKKGGWSPNRVFTGRERDKRYANFISNFDEDYHSWALVPLAEAFSRQFGETSRQTKKRLEEEDYELQLEEFVVTHANRVVQPVPPDYDSVGQETRRMIDESKMQPEKIFLQRRDGYSDIYMRNGKRWLFYRDKLKNIDGKLVAGEPLSNLWDDLLSNNLHNEGGVEFPKSKKPEALVKRVIELFSRQGDLVLDSFLGSGTTAAVAHKMGRKYIGIEMGEHAVTHCKPRLTRVVEGEQGGISQGVGWNGGGGFRFYRLGSPIFEADGQISGKIRFPVLAAHIWFSETGLPWEAKKGTPFLGIHDGRGFALLYNGILGDKSISGGNVLTRPTLSVIRKKLGNFDGPLTIYGERSALGTATLKKESITFKQTPYDVKVRV
jgi:adenine-specific DNA-methyltransferase